MAFGVVILIIQIVMQVMLGSYLPRRGAQQAVATVDFAASSIPVEVTAKDPADTQAVVRLLRGEVKIVESGETAGAFERMALGFKTASRAVHWVCLYMLFHLLWRLFQNLEQREIFSQRNLVLVRRLGAALVAYSIAALVIDLWKDWQIARYLADHYTFTGAQAFTQTATGDLSTQVLSAVFHYAQFDSSMCVIGLVVLVAAEVFRRGLALQEETDLTV